jgi:oxepin-CoA hydrolase/3-oxo-5,6-dehydrosuberyl-CoA semialdehyde dehydrogenase
MISGLVLKYLNGECFVICGFYKYTLLASTEFNLTVPFAEFTGDTFYAHTDDAAAKRNPFFPGRVAHGYLLLSFAAGLFVEPNEGPVLANTGLDNLRFMKPVEAGDSIKVRLSVKHKTPRNEDYGEVRWHVTLTNQDDEKVAEYELLTMTAYTS